MPEYLAPGVFYEEVSYRTKSISGVSTTTTGFIGAARFGPVDLEPSLITSLEEFERVYGDGQPLVWTTDEDETIEMPNYLWHAVRGFFLEGGRRLYISRVFLPIDEEEDTGHASAPIVAPDAGDGGDGDGGDGDGDGGDGDGGAADADAITVSARFPGVAGDMRVRFTFRVGQNLLIENAEEEPDVNGLLPDDLVMVTQQPDGAGDPTVDFRWAVRTETATDEEWTFTNGTEAEDIELVDLTPSTNPEESDLIQVVTVTVTVIDTRGREISVLNGLALAPHHTRNAAPDALNTVYAQAQPNPARAVSLPIVIDYGDNIATALDVFNQFTAALTDLEDNLQDATSTDANRSLTILLADGNDGMRPTATEFEGDVDPETDAKTGLHQFEDLEDISILAAPGITAGYAAGIADRSDVLATMNLLLNHARQMRYRIVILDSSDEESIAGVRRMRARLSSLYGALYYPWLTIQDPISRRPMQVPPSGYMAGIYARNDNTRGVFKAPANEVVGTAINLESTINSAQQEVLNPEGVNVIRFFEGRGIRVWGARCVTDDTEWMYVNVRRYFNYVGRSLDLGTQWAVFEPNDSRLWDRITQAISTFLRAEWRAGALLGDTPEQAFFVRCDRSTMTQYDLDQGRLICLVGIAPVKPAEFVILRVGQWTADANN